MITLTPIRTSVMLQEHLNRNTANLIMTSTLTPQTVYNCSVVFASYCEGIWLRGKTLDRRLRDPLLVMCVMSQTHEQ